MIDNNEINQLKERIRIEDVVSDLGISLIKKGRRLYCLCPFHDDHNPSMIISTDRNTYYCPVCNEHGSAINLLMKHGNLTYIEALKRIAPLYDMELHEVANDISTDQKRRQEYFEQIRLQRERVVKVASDILFAGDNVAYKYLRERGFTDDTLRQFNVGYLAEGDELVENDELIKKCYDARIMKGRIIFPWYSVSNIVVGLSGRVMDVRTKGLTKKYINSSEKSGFVKGSNLYGLNLAIHSIVKEKRVYVVEGYTDVMAMHQSGVENVVALNGTALTDAQSTLLKRYADEVVLCLDNDAAGLVAMDLAAQKLLPLDLKVEILYASEGCDPADMLLEYGEKAILDWSKTETRNILDICLEHFVQASVTNPYLRRTTLKKLLSYLSFIKDPILRAFYIEKCLAVCPYLKEQNLTELLEP